jgi:hypothetical protein
MIVMEDSEVPVTAGQVNSKSARPLYLSVACVNKSGVSPCDGPNLNPSRRPWGKADSPPDGYRPSSAQR